MITPEALAERHIPFSSLRYSTEAFVDYCIPECTPKYNYALIGPGVSQNPNQPINLREPHGFQVGAVSMPHGKTNPAHMHFTCEVFICVRGTWQVRWGFNPEDLHAEIGEGDIVSVPTWIYRGFTNVGVDDGFLFTALGGDNTGGILWGPTVIEAAAARGVQLTARHEIVDSSRGDQLPPGTPLFEPMTLAEIQSLPRWSLEAMSSRIVRREALRWSRHGLLDSTLPGGGAQLSAVIGMGIAQDRELAAPVMNPHGVSLEWMKIPPRAGVARHRLADKQVLLAACGQIELAIEASDGTARYTLRGAEAGWDSYAVPSGAWRHLANTGTADAFVLVMTAGDHRKTIEWDPQVTRDAAAADLAIDANGYVAPLRFVLRAQP